MSVCECSIHSQCTWTAELISDSLIRSRARQKSIFIELHHIGSYEFDAKEYYRNLNTDGNPYPSSKHRGKHAAQSTGYIEQCMVIILISDQYAYIYSFVMPIEISLLIFWSILIGFLFILFLYQESDYSNHTLICSIFSQQVIWLYHFRETQ